MSSPHGLTRRLDELRKKWRPGGDPWLGHDLGLCPGTVFEIREEINFLLDEIDELEEQVEDRNRRETANKERPSDG